MAAAAAAEVPDTLRSRWLAFREQQNNVVTQSLPAGKQVIKFGEKWKNHTFDEAWADQGYVGWCCQHMTMETARGSGNKLAWLNYLNMRMATELEVPEEEQVTGNSGSGAGTDRDTEGMMQRIRSVEQRMASMERMLSRILEAVAQQIQKQ